METMKDISINYKYTRNNRMLQMSINDKDSYEERQMNTFKCQIDTHHNMIKIYIYNVNLIAC